MAAASAAMAVARAARAPASARGVTAATARAAAPRRGMAVYRDFPEMGIKKQPFIEKNEIRRETTFYKWKPGTDNYFSVLMLVGVIPALLYVGNRSDLVTKATKKRGSKTAQQDYL